MIDEIILTLICLSWMGLFIPALIKRERQTSNDGDHR